MTNETILESASAERPSRQRERIDLARFLPSIIRNLAENISSQMSKSYNSEYFQLTTTEWRILLQLEEYGSLHAAQIVENTSMDKSKVSRALTGMEAEGIVQRQPDPADHRCQVLQLTAHGADIYRRVVPLVLEWERELIDGLEVSEYRDLLYLLDRLGQRLETMRRS